MVNDDGDLSGLFANLPFIGDKNWGKDKKACVFPFVYKGKNYDRCTSDHSENGKPWCAYEQVEGPSIEMVEGKWGECELGCPGLVFSKQGEDLLTVHMSFKRALVRILNYGS